MCIFLENNFPLFNGFVFDLVKQSFEPSQFGRDYTLYTALEQQKKWS